MCNTEQAIAVQQQSLELSQSLQDRRGQAASLCFLGHAQFTQGQYEEAEAVYRADLGLDGTLSRASVHPENVWSLKGLHECLIRRGETVEAAHIKPRLDLAAARAEVPVKASCFCSQVAMAAE